jgi:hypothetical protein
MSKHRSRSKSRSQTQTRRRTTSRNDFEYLLVAFNVPKVVLKKNQLGLVYLDISGPSGELERCSQYGTPLLHVTVGYWHELSHENRYGFASMQNAAFSIIEKYQEMYRTIYGVCYKGMGGTPDYKCNFEYLRIMNFQFDNFIADIRERLSCENLIAATSVAHISNCDISCLPRDTVVFKAITKQTYEQLEARLQEANTDQSYNTVFRDVFDYVGALKAHNTINASKELNLWRSGNARWPEWEQTRNHLRPKRCLKGALRKRSRRSRKNSAPIRSSRS